MMSKEEAESLFPYCETSRQAEVLRIIASSNSMKEVAEQSGSCLRSIQRMVERIKTQAANKGYAPGHWTTGTATGFKMHKVTIQRDAAGDIMQSWERQTPEQSQAEQIINAVDEACQRFKHKALPKIKPPKKCNKDLLTLYTITDFHLGMYAWAEECGEDWDVTIAQTVLRNAIDDMVNASPPSEEAIMNQLGDFMHWDGLDAVTPMSRHVLDADTRFEKLVELSIELIQYAIQRILEKHKKVKLINCEGNHDMASSVWLRKTMKYLFANNPRVEIDDTSFPFYAHLHGEIMLGFHHGHKVKQGALAKLFSSEPRYRDMWGKAKYTFVHTGHYHHQKVIEDAGCIIEMHPTLASSDSYSTRGGYVSWRAAKAITYHKETGERSRAVVHPDYKKR